LKQRLKALGVTKNNVLILLFLTAVIFWVAYCSGTGEVETAAEQTARALTLVLWSILLEALPFVLLGTLISGLIQVFVTEDMILRILPKNGFLRLVIAALIGLVFPVCECAIIPITRGLIKKGMPVGAAIAFMTAVPIVNPIVLLSTYNAFPTMPEMALWRAVFGFAAAVIIGLLSSRVSGGSVLKESAPVCGCGHDHSAHCRISGEPEGRPAGRFSAVKAVLNHTGDELKSVGAYLIFGALIAAAMQLLVPRELIAGIGSGRVSSTLVMMLLAFVMSLCSEADAFVASTFMLQFPPAAVLGFLITGPMIDIKNTMLLMGSFKKRFALRLIIIILLVCFALAMAASFLMGGAYE
jgi:hypothetical protein